jgi:hypothetical protein
MRGLRKCLLMAPAVAALAVAGCGGGDGEDTTAAAPVTTTEAPSLSKEELIAQGDAICAEVNAAVGTVSASETEASDRVSQEAELYTGMVERLKSLGTPDEAEGYEDFTAAADELAQAESDAQLASERGEEEALATAQASADSALASFQEAASTYGFKECGEAPSAPEVTPPGVAGGEEEVAPEEVAPEEAAPEEAAPEEAAPETGGAGGGTAEGGGTGGGGGEGGGASSGGIGPG